MNKISQLCYLQFLGAGSFSDSADELDSDADQVMRETVDDH